MFVWKVQTEDNNRTDPGKRNRGERKQPKTTSAMTHIHLNNASNGDSHNGKVEQHQVAPGAQPSPESKQSSS